MSNSSRAISISSAKKKCYKLLFGCFKVTCKGESEENISNHNSKDCDYIVEKLVVKRVPFVFFTIPKQTLEIKSDEFNDDIQHPLEKINTVYSSASETRSLLYYSESLNKNIAPGEIPNKCLHFDLNTTILNERNKKCTLPTDYNARILELTNTITSLYPDLKEHERPPKDPCPLNTLKDNISSKNIEKISPIKGFLNRNNGSQKQEVIKSKTSIQELYLMQKEFDDIRSPIIKPVNRQKIYNFRQDTYLNKFQNNDSSYCKKTFVIQPKQDVFYNLKNFSKFTNANQLNAESCDEELTQIDNKLQCSQQFLINESKVLTESVTNTNPSNTTIRWKIIVKHCKPT